MNQAEIMENIHKACTKAMQGVITLSKSPKYQALAAGGLTAVFLGAVSLGLLSPTPKKNEASSVNSTPTTSSVSKDTQPASSTSTFSSSLPTLEEDLVIGPVDKEKMPYYYCINIQPTGNLEPLEYIYLLDDIDKPDNMVCVYGYDRIKQRDVFYITTRAYKQTLLNDGLTETPIDTANLDVIEEIGLRELVFSGILRYEKQGHIIVSDGQTRNNDKWEDRYTAESFYEFADKLAAKHGRLPLIRPMPTVSNSTIPQEKPELGRLTRDSMDVMNEQFTVLEVHLWTLPEEQLPDVTKVIIEKNDGTQVEFQYSYAAGRDFEKEGMFVYGYDDTVGQCVAGVVPLLVHTDLTATDLLTNNTINCGTMTEKATVDMGHLALAAYSTDAINKDFATGDKVDTPEAKSIIVDPTNTSITVTFTQDAIMSYASRISESFAMPTVVSPPAISTEPTLVK